MATKSKYISDIELRLTKGNPSDDLELERRQIAHWLDIVRDELTAGELTKGSTSPENIDPYLLDVEEFVGVTEETPTIGAVDKQFVTLTNSPLRLFKDRGIVKVLGDDNVVINKTFPIQLGVINSLRHSAPSTENMLHYRIGNKLYILGMDSALILDYGIYVYYVRSYSLSPVGEDDEFKVPPDLVPLMLDEVEAIARRQMQQTDEDIINDGVQA